MCSCELAASSAAGLEGWLWLELDPPSQARGGTVLGNTVAPGKQQTCYGPRRTPWTEVWAAVTAPRIHAALSKYFMFVF